MSDFNGSGAASGATQGAAAGSAFGPWGTAIGAVAGGLLGGFGGSKEKVAQQQAMPEPYTQSGVTTPYGGLIVDPVTGRVVYSSTAGAFNPEAYRNQLLMDKLLGGNTATAGLDQQIAAIDAQIKALQQGSSNVQTKAQVLGDLYDPNTGDLINPTDYINKRGGAVPNNLWNKFMTDTGGNFGSKNKDISFNKWLRDTVKQYGSQNLSKWEHDKKTIESNQSVAQGQIAQLQQQLNSLQGYKDQVGSFTSPILDMFDQAGGGTGQANYLNTLLANQSAAQTQANRNALAARGMGSSTMQDLANAQATTQLGLAQQQNLQNVSQQGFQNRLNLLNYLTGANNASNQLGLSQAGMNLNYLTPGSSIAGNNAQNQWNINAGNIQAQNNQNMANANLSAINNQRNLQNWGSAAGALGYGLGNVDWSSMFGGGQPVTTQTNTGYGTGTGWADYLPEQNINTSLNTALPEAWSNPTYSKQS
jgi:hypothetical protein